MKKLSFKKTNTAKSLCFISLFIITNINVSNNSIAQKPILGFKTADKQNKIEKDFDAQLSATRVGQNIKLLPEDTLYAGTSPQSLAYRMAEMTGKNNVKQTSQGSNSTLDITHRIAFDNLPPQINEGNLVHHMEKIMNNITCTCENCNESYYIDAPTMCQDCFFKFIKEKSILIQKEHIKNKWFNPNKIS